MSRRAQRLQLGRQRRLSSRQGTLLKTTLIGEAWVLTPAYWGAVS